MSREAMQLALEALETNNKAWKHLADSGDAGFWEAEEQPFYELSVKAIATLRQALETEREWVGLMDEEFMAIAQKYSLPTRVGLEYFKDELEAKLKEKNT